MQQAPLLSIWPWQQIAVWSPPLKPDHKLLDHCGRMHVPQPRSPTPTANIQQTHDHLVRLERPRTPRSYCR